MKNLLFVLILSCLFISCGESDVCACLSESTAQMKKERLSRKLEKNTKQTESCKKMDHRYKNASAEELEKISVESKACSNYKNFIEEMKIYDEFREKELE